MSVLAPLPFSSHNRTTGVKTEVFVNSEQFTELAKSRINAIKAHRCIDCGGHLIVGQERVWNNGKGIKALECDACDSYFLPSDWMKSA